MKQRLFGILVAILLVGGASHVRAQYPDPYFTDENRPNPLYFLYEPPVNSMTPEGEFYNDWWHYEWGKTEREYSYAVWDEDAELMSEEELGVYNDVLGIEVGDRAVAESPCRVSEDSLSRRSVIRTSDTQRAIEGRWSLLRLAGATAGIAA